MKPRIQSIIVMTHTCPTSSSDPFVNVFFGRSGDQSNRSRFNPTPSSMLRVMRWQAATLLANRKAEAAP